MNKRTLTRKVIIREYDFNRVCDQSLNYFDGDYTLYDRASFTPLNQENLEKIKLVEILKGKHSPITEADLSLKSPALFLFQVKDYLYNERYYEWTVTEDDEGYLCVQARKNTPKSRIGWGVFEKDFTSRL